VVAVVGKGLVLAEGLGVTGVEALAELAHLGAGVVDVVLPLDLKPRGLQHAGQGVADDGVSCRPDGDGASRVGADELDLDALPSAEIDVAPILPGLETSAEGRWSTMRVAMARGAILASPVNWRHTGVA
jgi:hypothetical protein